MAFPGCIPLEQAIRLRGEGRFEEKEWYDAEKFRNKWDSGQEAWLKRMSDEVTIREKTAEYKERERREQEELQRSRKEKEEAPLR